VPENRHKSNVKVKREGNWIREQWEAKRRKTIRGSGGGINHKEGTFTVILRGGGVWELTGKKTQFNVTGGREGGKSGKEKGVQEGQ